MKRLKKVINLKKITQIVGITIGIAAIYLSLRNIQGKELADALRSMNTFWIIPIIVGNFGVIAFKTLRWQIMIRPIKHINFRLMYRVLMIGFMVNNILPARLGEAVRIHLLGKDASLSRITTTATLISDRIIEGLSLIILAAILIISTDVPKWMLAGLTIMLPVIAGIYVASIVYSMGNVKNRHLKKFQDGTRPLLHLKSTVLALIASMLSWFMQGLLIYMTQLAFGVHLPVWGIILVLISINLIVVLPSTPGYIGTFELACILAYSYLGVDKSLGLLMGATFHLLQIIPVTLVGGVMMLSSHVGLRKTLLTEGPEAPC